MNRMLSRNERRALEAENRRWPAALTEIPRGQWPLWPPGMTPPRRVLRSRDFLVQEFDCEDSELVVVRLSVCRTSVEPGGRWEDGITWDDLQRLKRECGYGDRDAVEVFPRDCDVVNVANMRHVWVLDIGLAFAWRRGST